MNSLYCILISCIVVCILGGCRKDNSINSMAFDSVLYVEKFPNTYQLENGKKLDFGLMGMHGLTVQDSLLIVSTSDKTGYWSFFNLQDYSFLGKYLTEGKSENEFLSSPRVDRQYFTNRGGELYAMIYDFSTGKILSMNIAKTLENKRLNVSEQIINFQRTLFNFLPMSDSSFFCREVNNDHTQQSRFLVLNNNRIFPDNMNILNKASLEIGADINILGCICKYHPQSQKIVEVGLDLNLINLYSINNSFAFTICVGNELDRIEDIQKIDRRKKKVMYQGLNSYENYFAALYQNDTNENIHFGKAKKQTIQFFDWKGNPLIEVVLDRRVNSFDIDFSKKCLYTLSYEDDEIYVYDFSEALRRLETV